MLNFDTNLEIRVLKTLMDKQETRFLTLVSLDWFGFPPARELWQRINTLRQHGKQIPSSHTLAGDPVLSEETRACLEGEIPPFETNEFDQAFDQLNYYRKGRVLVSMAQKVVEGLKDQNANPDKAKVEVERALAMLQDQKFEEELLSYGHDLEKTVDLYERVMDENINDQVIPTGFKIIDKQQGGLHRGGVYTIGAPSGGGKSTFANQIAINVAKAGFSCGYNSFEMNREKNLLRTQSNISRIPHQKLKLKNLTADERKRSDKALAQFLAHCEAKGIRLDYFCPSQDLNIAQLFSITEPLGYDVEVVDYINLMAYLNPKEGLWWNIGEGFRLAKRYAERTKKVVIMLVQIDEETGDIKYAKSIKHHSDGVWLWKYGAAERETKIVEVDQTKMRDFEPIKFSLQAEFEFCAFTESFGTAVESPQPVKPMKFD